MNLRDTVDYTRVEGARGDRHIRVYALSTCAFCEKAINWLRDQGFAFEYIFVDNLELGFKRQLKAELKETYGDLSVFPVMVVDHTACISGFTEEKYLEALPHG